jgi:hypothetical protein
MLDNNVQNVNPNPSPDGGLSQVPIPTDAGDNTPVIQVPAGAVPPQIANAPHPDMETIIVNGKAIQITPEQRTALAQKGAAADEKFQDAATQRKEAESAIQLKDDFEILKETGDINAFRRIGAQMGLPGDQVEEAARIVYEGVNPDGDPDDENRHWDKQEARGRGAGTPVDAEKLLSQIKAEVEGHQVGYDNLSDDVKTALLHVEEKRIHEIVEKALDTDEVIRYYMNSYEDRGKEAIRTMVDEKIRGRLDDSDGQFGDGARILREVIPEVRTHLEAIGTPSRTTPQMGLGPAPGGTGNQVYPTKPPDHVPSTETGFEDHITQTLAHNLGKGQ